MRTDSTLLSSLAIGAIGDFINKDYGKSYHAVRQFKTKNASAQEAHEAIRPTDVRKRNISGDPSGQKLYELIWKRAVASQMSDASMERAEMEISISNQSELFIAKGESLIFDGFMRVWGGTKDDVILPKLNVGDELKLSELEAKQQFSRSPARYSEASLVRKLEELGIGRPSTYAPTISTIQSRGYVEKADLAGEERSLKIIRLNNGQLETLEEHENAGADNSKLVPTPIAEVTTDFLIKYFPSIVDYAFTARVEADFDEVARGKRAWNKMIGDFYKDFHPLVEQTQGVSRHEVSQARLVGNDPSSGHPIYARFGRYGPMLQRGETSTETKPEFAALPAGKTMDNINLAEALEMFKLPRTVGKTAKGEEILANIGRFGPYIKVGSTFVSIKGFDPHQISVDEARKLYEEKLNIDANKQIKVLDKGIKILKGPYGHYVTNGKRNARIAKGHDPATITQSQAEELLAKTPTKRRRFKKAK
ncbi:MAG: DNA topoisomerase, partial [Candidatus Saccharimonadales bacterium]